MKQSKSLLLNAAVAGIFAAGTGLSFASAAFAADEAKVKCSAGNACKGKGECGGAGHSCAGKNECKGKGWVKTTAAECAKAGGKVEAGKKS